MLSTFVVGLAACAGVAYSLTLPACTVVNAHPTGTVCGARGFLNTTSTSLVQAIGSPSIDDCQTRCLHFAICGSFGYNTANDTCLIYDGNAENNNFVRDPTSSVKYFDYNCFNVSGFCGVVNPSFELVPRGHPVGTQDPVNIRASPWFVVPMSFPGRANVQTNSGVVGTQAPTPDGEKFLHILVPGAGSSSSGYFVAQDVYLEPNVNYKLSFDYNFYSAGLPNSTLPIGVGFINTDQSLSFSAPQDSQWHHFSGVINYNYTNPAVFIVAPLSPSNGTDYTHGVVLFDNLLVEPTLKPPTAQITVSRFAQKWLKAASFGHGSRL